MRVAVVQYRPPKGEPERARQALAAAITEADARLVVCPEMATTGYVWPDRASVEPHAEPARGPTLEALGPVAARHRSWVVTGIVERGDDDRLYNAALVIGPSGSLVACYRKVFLFELDHTWALPGDRRMLCESIHGLIAPLICMDLNDPRVPAFLAETTPDFVAFPTNWIDEGVDIVPYWRQRLAGWRGVFLAADSWGDDGPLTFYGRSAILGRDGQVLAMAGNTADTVLGVDLNR